MSAPAIRIGEGWDTHALVTGRPLILGGVTIPHTHGLLGHSDADALLHAITDALLGAAGLGDIGRHFPDTDEQFKGADSGALLAEAARRVRAAGWQIGNIDSTIVAQGPNGKREIDVRDFVLGPFTMGQLLSVPMLAAGLYLIVTGRKRPRLADAPAR